MSRFQAIIGRSEYIDIVDRALGVPAKIDTGAFRSAIHATNVRVANQNDKEVLTCDLLGHPCSPVVRKYETTEFSRVSVTNSFGAEEERYEIRLKTKLGPKVFKSSFTLADRSNNLFPILVGRKFLHRRFLVDVSLIGIDRMNLKKTFGVKSPVDEEDLEG